MKECSFYTKYDNYIKCNLCPRNCKINENKTGFCGIRKNINSKLYNTNWGIIIPLTIKPVSTNAIYTLDKDELSIGVGSIGCNLDCAYCQSWKYTHQSNINLNEFEQEIEPIDIINFAKDYNIKYISFTFNDPISIFDYIIEICKLAKQNDIRTIFKSNMYLNKEPLNLLMSLVDIFSISIKSIKKEFYKEICNNVDLDIILDNVKLIYLNGNYLEISNLICPHSNKEKDLNDLSLWIKNNLNENIPLHVVKYHPEYKMKGEIKEEEIYKLQNIAQQHLTNVFMGNI